ncbi:MAG: squalene/phytoene synthase family protein [Deltaproteobacteria bacterium]|nr:squalene/phytoene synthase family protein [Myxococcales bacterium]MDP3215188.1 squalene/phytoene synthase family protein [Deltaproteobacteria bacterium]
MIDLAGLLERTSRTFALSIPRLPEPTRLAVTLAYLLFRIADTFEDAAVWPRERRVEVLVDFMALLDQQNQSPDGRPPARATDVARHWSALRPSEHQGYVDLVAATPGVLDAVAGLSPASRAVVLRHASRTAEGMRRFVENSYEDGTLDLSSLEELRDYCYVVAGIVGELLTDLFLLDAPALQASAHALRSRARDFGEGLQLVNILKDVSDDARDGRTYLPPDTDRSEILALARADLASAAEYVLTLQRGGAPRGFVEFTALPVLLAVETLALLERDGPGAKLPRERVMTLVSELDARLDVGAPAL